jgi:hypothetical protein
VFAEAYQIASCFTLPAIVSVRYFDKTVECGCGAFIVINDEGWIMTVAHLFESFFAYQQHAKEIADFDQQARAIQQDSRLDIKQKRKRIGRLKSNPKWITAHSFWWGRDGIQLQDIKLLPEGDLVLGRLNPFDPQAVESYPIFKEPAILRVGTSLCKLGFPFHKIEATHDESKNAFQLAPGTLPLPRFPIEGIYTRNASAGKTTDGKYEIKFLETSSPGLRGQSGGPIFDIKGTIWAMQSRTTHFPLGFSPKIKQNGREVEEHQFLNVGLGVHPELIVSFLRDNGINFRLSDY